MRISPDLVFDFPADLLERPLLGLCEWEPGGHAVALGDQGPLLLLREVQRAVGAALETAQIQRL